MRQAIRQPLAVVFGVLVVTAAVLGSVAFVNDDVQTLGGASDQLVQRGEAGAVTVGALILGYAAAHYTYNEYVKKSGNTPTDQLNGTDWQETHTNIYQSFITQSANIDATLSVMENYLNDTRSIALMNGKKAYVQALNNGATKGEAEVAAHEAVESYYLTKQKNVIASVNATIAVGQNAYGQLGSSPSGVSKNDLLHLETSSANEPQSFGTESVQLVDGSTHDVLGFRIATDGEHWHPGGSFYDPTSLDQPGIMAIPPSGTEFEKKALFHPDRVDAVWADIEQQNTDVQNSLSSFIEATYSDYEAGRLNSSDFVDPYMGARDYSPETSNTWTLRTLSSMGVSPPENLSNIGLMNVSTAGTTYRGVLMSQGTPSGGFGINETYNASNIAGPQWIAMDDGDSKKLSGEFTLESATRADGTEYSENETVTYTNVSYESANISQLEAQLNETQKVLAEINARQQELRNSGGSGWLPDFGGINLGTVAPVAILAGGALVLLGRN